MTLEGEGGTRRITDAAAMRALSHPVRIALLEALFLEGAPLTATEAAERIGESPTTCSFHLRQLAKYGFVEEADGGKGRARPWRVTSTAMNISSTDDDPEAAAAAAVLTRIFRTRLLERYQAWLETKGTFPKEWRDAADEAQLAFFVTAEELRALNDELLGWLLPRFRDRLTDRSLRPAGSIPVEMLILSYPVTLPKKEA